MNYRPEIDGLRAIAVLSVVFFHAGLTINGSHLFPGGYLGVDIFFVISGYLITSILIRELKEEKFSFKKFYERRARRILPALALVTLATIPLGWVFMDVGQLDELARSIISVTIFLSNLFFLENISYFSSSVELKPLLHTWSLAVEEQYYVLFPIVMLLCWKYARRHIVAIFVTALVLSLTLANWTSQKYPDASFYLLTTRGWELLAGALLAKLESKYERQDNKAINSTFSVLGMLLVVYSIAAFDVNTLHPAFLTALPVSGVMLIIWFSGKDDVVTKILSSKPFVGIGLISYSLYLWHQPILANVRLSNLGKIPDGSEYWLIALLIVISTLSWKFVEQPFRSPVKVSSKKAILLLTVSWSAIFAIGAVIHWNGGFPERLDFPQSVTESFKYGDGTEEPHKCIDVAGAYEEPGLWCKLGVEKNGLDFFMFGDSHAFSAIPQFDYAAKELGLAGIAISQSGCLPFLNIEPSRRENGLHCVKLNQEVFKYVKENRIKKLFLVARWNYYTVGLYSGIGFQNIRNVGSEFPDNQEGREKVFENGLINTLREYKKLELSFMSWHKCRSNSWTPKRHTKTYITGLYSFRTKNLFE